jgi:hypothetical protein
MILLYREASSTTGVPPWAAPLVTLQPVTILQLPKPCFKHQMQEQDITITLQSVLEAGDYPELILKAQLVEQLTTLTNSGI